MRSRNTKENMVGKNWVFLSSQLQCPFPTVDIRQDSNHTSRVPFLEIKKYPPLTFAGGVSKLQVRHCSSQQSHNCSSPGNLGTKRLIDAPIIVSIFDIDNTHNVGSNGAGSNNSENREHQNHHNCHTVNIERSDIVNSLWREWQQNQPACRRPCS